MIGCSRGRVVAELGILQEAANAVDAKATRTAVEPEAQDRVELVADFRIPPVEVRLAGQERMQVVLAGPLIEGPGGAPENGQPVVRRRAVRLGIGPHVPLPVARRPR